MWMPLVLYTVFVYSQLPSAVTTRKVLSYTSQRRTRYMRIPEPTSGLNRFPSTPVAFVAVSVWAAGVLAPAALAQDTHYWNTQYGPRAMLLGGTLVGSVDDMSATYYNPGALTMIEGREALLSGQAFEYQSIRLESDAPIAQDLSSSTFGTAPTLFAGLIPSNWLPGQLAYSALTRQRLKARLTSRLIEGGLPDEPVELGIAGEVDLAHPAFAEPAPNLIAADPLPLHRSECSAMKEAPAPCGSPAGPARRYGPM